jgi:hypothetical protein
MTPRAHRRFWACYEALPRDIQDLVRAKFVLWRRDPFHPSLRFKELARGIWSVRIGRGYRALARRLDDLVVWFWIGTHADYDRLVSR